MQQPMYFYSMAFKDELLSHFKNGHEQYLRHISVDCIIFGFHSNELKVLLLEAKYAGAWALPGGFVLDEREADRALNGLSSVSHVGDVKPVR